MITLLRWYLLKAKQIKIKLLFYSITEQVIKEFINQNKDWEQKIVHELAQIIHNSNAVSYTHLTLPTTSRV